MKIREGEIFGLIGQSGGGKSTVLRILLGMAGISSGNIYFNGKDALSNLNFLRKKTGFATQENTLIDELSMWENAVYFGRLYGLSGKIIRTRFKELISLLDLDGYEDLGVRNLSGGMKKRANLLISLIHNPKLLILDEPTTGLDTILRESLWKYIRQINKEGTTILVTSHLLDEIENNCDTIAILGRGKIITSGLIKDYFDSFPGKKSLNEIFLEVLKNENSFYNN